MNPKPLITRTTHVLPFDRLSWQDFERLCLALLLREGFSGLEHLGATGHENGRDIVGTRDGQLWYVQCKRVGRIGAQDLLREIAKMVPGEGSTQKRPDGLLFMVACTVSAQSRDRVAERCEALGVACHFWAQTELDARLHAHPDVIREFFALPAADPEPYPVPLDGEDLPSAGEYLVAEDEQTLLPFAFLTPERLERELEETQKRLHDSYLRRIHAGPDAVDPDTEERTAVELCATLTELGRAWSIVQRAHVPAHMLIKDFLEGNIYGAVLANFVEPLAGDFDDLAVARAIGSESPMYRRKLARRLLDDPDASDAALAKAIHRTIKALVARPGSPYVRVADNRYRRVYR